MPLFKCDPALELNGLTVSSLMVSTRNADIQPILEKYHLTNIDPTAWYPLQDVLNVLHDIANNSDSTVNLVSIGMAAGELGANNLPAEMKDAPIEDIFAAYGKVYKMRHRNGDPGSISTEKLGPKHIAIIMQDSPYPDDVYYGVFYAYARALLPTTSHFTVKYDTSLPRQREGGEKTIIHIEWT